MKRRFFVVPQWFFACAPCVILCCAAKSEAAQLDGAGATFPYPLYSKWFEAYRRETGMQINYQAVGSGAGIKVFLAGQTDFAATNRSLTREEARQMKNDVVCFPTVAASVAVVYNLKGVPHLRLSPQVLSAIYLGRITRWNDARLVALNPQARLSATPIIVTRRWNGSGTTRIFRAYLQAVSAAWKKQSAKNRDDVWPVGKDDHGVDSDVRQVVGSIGYVEWAYAAQNRMSVAAIRNRGGNFALPSIAATQAAVSASLPLLQKDFRAPIVDAPGATSYPICGLTYVLIRKTQRDAATAHQLRRFWRWAMRDGQKFAAPLLYAPLPDALRQRNQRAISRIRAASTRGD